MRRSDDQDLVAALRDVLADLGEPSDGVTLRPLSGGASRQTSRVERTDAPSLILQRERTEEPRLAGGMADEADVVVAAAASGVPVPRILASNRTHPDSPIGPSFLLATEVPGETIARKILRDDTFARARTALTAQAGAALAGVHATPVTGLPSHVAASDQLAMYRASMDDIGLVSPTFELTFRWLERHRPPARPPVLVHGDFRLGNLIVDGDGLAAVIDWELAHLSDPMEDLGWLCVRAWRFGGARPVAGVGERSELWSAYEAAGGSPVDPQAAHWWEVLGHLKWGVMCGIQLAAHTSGAARSVELAAIGRRIGEQEFDLIRLIEEPTA